MTCKECIHKSVCYRVDSVPIAYAQKCGDFVSGKALEQEPKWIPVTNRLSKPYEQVLRTVKSFGWNGTFHIYVDIGTICPIDTDVLAWLPLPEPYKAESEEV